MSKRIVIGKGKQLCAAEKCFDIEIDDIHVSENSKSYWVSLYAYDVSMVISKDTPEGERITALRKHSAKAEANNVAIAECIYGGLFQKMDFALFQRVIGHIEHNAYKKGKKDIREDLRSVLGL